MGALIYISKDILVPIVVSVVASLLVSTYVVSNNQVYLVKSTLFQDLFPKLKLLLADLTQENVKKEILEVLYKISDNLLLNNRYKKIYNYYNQNIFGDKEKALFRNLDCEEITKIYKIKVLKEIEELQNKIRKLFK